MKLTSFDKDLIWWLVCGVIVSFTGLYLTTHNLLITSFAYSIYALIVLITFLVRYPKGNFDPTISKGPAVFEDTPPHIHNVKVYEHGISWWKWYFPFEEIYGLEEDTIFNTVHHTLHHHLHLPHKKFHRYLIQTSHKEFPNKMVKVYDNDDFIAALKKVRPDLQILK
ncbi:MAG TPA: hypothetical protein VK158_02545 [Acidobacteriota bacterium]|nr:hypothetical protein [Acidobacteriota bacterium]